MIATRGGNYTLAGAGKTVLAAGTVPAPGVCTAAGSTVSVISLGDSTGTATVTGTWKCRVPGVGVGPGTAGPDTDVVVKVVDRFCGLPSSVAITTTITTDKAVPFTQALRTPLTWSMRGGTGPANVPAAGDSKTTASLSSVWTSWGKVNV